jgi:hypothetical protein
MPVLWLIPVAATIEAATGVALIVFPETVARLLLGGDLADPGIAVARVAGIALLALGLGCWMTRHPASATASALTALLIYNLPVTIYLASLGIGGELVGILLWPAIVLHAVLSVLLGYTWFKSR